MKIDSICESAGLFAEEFASSKVNRGIFNFVGYHYKMLEATKSNQINSNQLHNFYNHRLIQRKLPRNEFTLHKSRHSPSNSLISSPPLSVDTKIFINISGDNPSIIPLSRKEKLKVADMRRCMSKGDGKSRGRHVCGI